MLISFSIENYGSIRDRQTLSLQEDTSISDDTAPLIYNNEELPNLLRAVAIYGANASGKSTFLRAIQEMRSFVLASAKQLTEGDKIKVVPFLLDNKSKENPSKFEIVFIIEGVKYEYGYSVTKNKVVEEFLNAYPKKIKQNWFKRTLTSYQDDEYDWSFSVHFKGEKEAIKASTRSNALFFSTAVQLNNEMLSELQIFFSKKFFVEQNKQISKSYTAKYMKENLNGKNKVTEFLKRADIGIDDFKIHHEHVKEEQIQALLDGLPKNITEEEKDKIRREILKEEMVTVRSVHINPETNEHVEFPLEYESVGTLKLYSMAGLWLEALERGQTLVIDELENSLHCKLVGYLIKLFNNPITNPNNAQLIFTTHSSVALDSNDLRRDQIWFTKKDNHSQTVLFSLLDVRIDGKLVRKDKKRIKAYLEGAYSAVPNIPNKYQLS